MNFVIIHPSEFDEKSGIAKLSGRRVEHMLNVLKLDERSGICKVGLLGGMMGSGELVELDRESMQATLCLTLNVLPPNALPLKLIAAVPRPKSFRKVLHGAISMGVKELWFVHTFKVDKSYWQTPWLSEEALQSEIILALEQAGDTVMPKLEFRRRFKPFVEDELAQIAKDSNFLVAHPSGITEVPVGFNRPITLCLGPEGGFTDYEVELLNNQGAESVTLGSRILRTEVALPALLARLYTL